MRKFLDWMVLGVLGLLLPASAVAAPLTQTQVSNYIASHAEAQALTEQIPIPQKNIDRHRPLVSGVELLAKDSQLYQSLGNIAQRHHFRNPEQWADVGDRVMNAYFIAKQGTTLELIKRNYKEAEQRINSNPDYTEQHKKAVLVGMEKGYLRNVGKIQDAQPDLPAVIELMDLIAPLYAQ
jgi:hypothetical protein